LYRGKPGRAAPPAPSCARSQYRGSAYFSGASKSKSRTSRLAAAGREIAAARTPERFACELFEAIAPFAQKRKNWSAWQPFDRPHRFGRLFGR